MQNLQASTQSFKLEHCSFSGWNCDCMCLRFFVSLANRSEFWDSLTYSPKGQPGSILIMQKQINHCQQLLEREDYDALQAKIEQLIDSQAAQEDDLQQKQEQLQQNQKVIAQLEEEENVLRDFIEDQLISLENERQILQRVEQELLIQKNKEAHMLCELKEKQDLEHLIERQKEDFAQLYNQCHQIHDENLALDAKIQDLENENNILDGDCAQLEAQLDAQSKLNSSLKALNLKTEETINRLQTYQEELKNLLQQSPIESSQPKFDPIEFIKNISTAHQEDLPEVNGDEEESDGEADETEVQSKSKTLDYKRCLWVGAISVGVLTVFLLRKTLR